MKFFTHSDFEYHEKMFGHPSDPLPLSIREAYIKEGMAIPVRKTILSVHTPPGAGFCHVCGTPVPTDQHLRAYAVAGFEDAKGSGGEPLRLLVTHCNEHVNSDACSRDKLTPGSGITDAPGGFCESIPNEVVLGGSLFPGAWQLSKFLVKAAIAGIALGALMFGAIQTSEGQQINTLQGGNHSIGASTGSDSTSGHGYNDGYVNIYTGSAPATADAGATGTLLIAWLMPAPLFGTASSTIPSVLTANAISNVNASNSGTAGYGRLIDAGGTDTGSSTTDNRIMFAVGTSGSDMNFNTLSIVSSGACSLTSFTITHGA